MTLNVTVRDLKYNDIMTCAALAGNEWGAEAGARAGHQMVQMFTTNPDRPHFYVATVEGTIIGFCGFAPTMLMKDAYDLIWIALAPNAQGQRLGTRLTEIRLEEIKRRGGRLVSLMTQKPAFFTKLGFMSVGVYDGWSLMTQQLAKVEI